MTLANHLPIAPMPGLPARDPHGHKGTFGTVAVVGGCCESATRMIGAPALAGRGALRAGAGLVRLVMPEPILNAGLVLLPSATGVALPTNDTGAVIAHRAAEVFDWVLTSCDAVVIGPGFGTGAAVQALTLRVVQQEDLPIVVDADALNALANVPELFRDFRAPAILTPHPGEFARLARAFRVDADPVDHESRPRAAAELAQRLGCVVVLKGSGTVVSDGHKVWVCSSGHACLGTAGTGDVLAGTIAGLISQFARKPPQRSTVVHGPGSQAALTLFEAAQLGVEAHARASERWASRDGRDAGLLATELADELPPVLSLLRVRG